MALTKRCPDCGASNREDAEWCSLCLERFDQPEPEPEPEAAAPDDPVASEPPDDVANETGAPGTVATKTVRPTKDTGAFRVSEEGITWVCEACGKENDLERTTCEICGTTFAETVQPKTERPARDPGTAALLSLFLPGAGHAYVGMWGQAVARTVLSLWALVVVALALLDTTVPGAIMTAVLFGLVALVLWVVTAHDAYREAANESKLVLLRGRRFLFVVLGLMGLLVVSMLIALLMARGRAQAAPLSIPAWPSTSSPIFMEQPTD